MLSQRLGTTGTSIVQPTSQSGINTITDTCGSVCQAYINNAIESQLKVSTSSSTTALSPKTQIIYQAPPTQTQVTYIPLSGGNTQNTEWTTISSSQITFNISDYGAKAYAVWDANLKVDNANGQTFARLFDTTHGIAVNGSEISISNTSTSTDIVSGQLQFWQGNNTYVVQLKSLNSSIAFMDSGRIKINY